MFIILIISTTLYRGRFKQQMVICNSHYINIIDPQGRSFHHNHSKFTEHPLSLLFLVTRLEKKYLKGFTQKVNVGIRKETCYIHSAILWQSWPHQIAKEPRKESYHLSGRKEPESRPNDFCTWQPAINVFSWSSESHLTHI